MFLGWFSLDIAGYGVALCIEIWAWLYMFLFKGRHLALQQRLILALYCLTRMELVIRLNMSPVWLRGLQQITALQPANNSSPADAEEWSTEQKTERRADCEVTALYWCVSFIDNTACALMRGFLLSYSQVQKCLHSDIVVFFIAFWLYTPTQWIWKTTTEKCSKFRLSALRGVIKIWHLPFRNYTLFYTEYIRFPFLCLQNVFKRGNLFHWQPYMPRS